MDPLQGEILSASKRVNDVVRERDAVLVDMNNRVIPSYQSQKRCSDVKRHVRIARSEMSLTQAREQVIKNFKYVRPVMDGKHTKGFWHFIVIKDQVR